jgi:hypothetical protein
MFSIDTITLFSIFSEFMIVFFVYFIPTNIKINNKSYYFTLLVTVSKRLPVPVSREAGNILLPITDPVSRKNQVITGIVELKRTEKKQLSMDTRDKTMNYIGGFLHHPPRQNEDMDWKNFLITKKVLQQLKKETQIILELSEDTSQGNSIPQSLVRDGKLCKYDIYRIATISHRELALVCGYETDLFPEIVPNTPWDGNGVLPDCHKSLSNGDDKHSEQWHSLNTWHAGLSAHLLLNPKQEILFDMEDPEIHKEFNARRSQNMKNETGSFRLLLVYLLKKGTSIPPDIGIEVDGDNHVCLYPTEANATVSDIAGGFEYFTIDSFKALQPFWKPFAIVQIRASGFRWPEEFPPDSVSFPLRKWLADVISYSDSDIAMSANSCTEDYLSGNLVLKDYFSKLLIVARRYWMDCCCDHIDMTRTVIEALKFVLNMDISQD